MKIREIVIEEPFKRLFRIREEVYKDVLKDIKENGYDENEPILVWKNRNILIDGHTRLQAAMDNGLKEIPDLQIEFNDEDEALRYAVKRNSNRRAVTMGDKARLVRLLDNPTERGGNRNPEGINQYLNSGQTVNSPFDHKSSEEDEESAIKTAKLVGLGDQAVKRIRVILRYGPLVEYDNNLVNDVENDNIAINSAYKLAKEKRDAIEEELKKQKQFNRTNESIEWAKWTWNPYTGCKHNCPYCYARDIANRFYKEGFEPTFRPERLSAPKDTNIPESQKEEEGINNVFVVSMGDLLGEWVEKEHIEAIINSMENSPQWNYILLTKNPKRYKEFAWPKTCWLGATADTQSRMDIALKEFKDIEHPIKFVSCEPLMEKIILPEHTPIDWLIIGGRSKSSGMPAGQPEWEWVLSLLLQCNKLNIPVYMKPNLTVRSKKYPK